MAAATGVSERTVYRLCKEAKEAKDTYEHATVFREPHNHRSATVTLFDEFEKCLLRRTVLNFYARKEIPTLEQVFVEMKERSEFKGCKVSLRKVLLQIGFKYGHVNGRRFLLERSDVGSARAKFLRKMTELRNSGFTHSIIYLDETWINQNHSHSKCWIDTKSNKATGIHTPTGKGGRLIILHAGSKDGFIKNAELIFQAKHVGDYHHQMNHVDLRSGSDFSSCLT